MVDSNMVKGNVIENIENLKENIFRQCEEFIYDPQPQTDIFRKAVEVSRSIISNAARIARNEKVIYQTYDENPTLEDCEKLLSDIYDVIVENDFVANKERKILRIVASNFIDPSQVYSSTI